MANVGDTVIDPETGRAVTVLWNGARDGRGSDLLLSYDHSYTRQRWHAEDHRTAGATYDAVNIKARNWGPVRSGRLYE